MMEGTTQQHDERSAKRGRPVGSTIFNRDSFLRHSIEAYRKLMNIHDKHPSQYDVAAELLIARATLTRYLYSFGISWGEVREIAMRKLPDTTPLSTPYRA